MNNFEYALRCYQKALEINPKCSAALSNIGTYFFRRDDYKKAIEYYKRALESNPQDSSAWKNIGVILY